MVYKDLEKRRETERIHYLKNPELRAKKILCRYKNRLLELGLSLSDYDKILKEQNSCCKICGRSDGGRKNGSKLCVDHCHTTGKVRGLLCYQCNQALGLFKDNISSLRNAANYLEDAYEK